MRTLRLVFLAMALTGSALGQEDFPLPPPQIASAAGVSAPEFRLKNQDSQYMTLSSMRGGKVLLMFYRGYW